MPQDDPRDDTASDEPATIVSRREQAPSGAQESSAPLWTHAPDISAGGTESVTGDPRRHVDEALAGLTSDSRTGADRDDGADAGGSADRRSSSDGDGAERGTTGSSSAAGTNVTELAASTTTLIHTAQPFFLAFFGIVFTTLGFLEGNSATSQWFVAGAIIFILAAAFSADLGDLATRRRTRATGDDA